LAGSHLQEVSRCMCSMLQHQTTILCSSETFADSQSQPNIPDLRVGTEYEVINPYGRKWERETSSYLRVQRQRLKPGGGGGGAPLRRYVGARQPAQSGNNRSAALHVLSYVQKVHRRRPCTREVLPYLS
jgi:hypothetical protein